MQRPSDERLGQLIGGKYAIDEVIARGGMGVVYGARHRGTGRSVAVKLLRPELSARPDLVRRVSAEARLAVEASHPNVVEVLDAGADEEGVPYVVLERLYGSSLDALLTSRLPLLPALQALIPISTALMSLHAAGIVHRDIKPSNLFLSRHKDGRITPKLLDFGIAKALEPSTSTLSGVALGTPMYMAPEQALGWASTGPATDIWSLGVVLVRCLTGQLPFEARGEGRIGSLGAGVSPAELEGMHETLAQVVSHALRFEPAERFATMADFRSALLAAAAEIDPSQSWPTPDTVTYSATETELSKWLARLEDEARCAESAALPSGRRPAHIETRTLRTRPEARRSRRQIAVMLALVSSVAVSLLYAARAERTSIEAAGELELETAPSEAVPPLLRESEVLTSDGDAESRREHDEKLHAEALPGSAAAPSPSASDATPASRSEARRSAAPPPAGGAEARPPAANLPSRARGAAPEETLGAVARPKPALGANRSPIIE